jgi:4-hydroxythreonine-4-phosphate dehydrogenase
MAKSGQPQGMAPPLALTMGEPAGIGGELALMAWRELRSSGPAFVALDDPQRLERISRSLGMAVPIRVVDDMQAASRHFADALPVLPIILAIEVAAGHPRAEAAKQVIESIDRAVALARAGSVSGVVTNPIHKATLYGVGFKFPGHTEYLLELAGGKASGHNAIMMLASEELRVVPVTVHLPLRRAIDTLSSELIVEAGMVTAKALRRDFGIDRPRLAVAGLNPHAGEEGALGGEEQSIVAPAIRQLQEKGIDASGPWPPDAMFHAQARARYDAALCLYHDQALIPLKTLDFFGGVNVTLGLPFVRTSPDHGTAFDIAGTGKANPQSLIAAIRLAARMAERRRSAS